MLRPLAVAVALLVAAPAAAGPSFANRELGLGLGAFTLVPPGGATPTLGLPLTLEGGLYLEHGFDLFLRVPLALLQQGAAPATFFGTGAQLGVRYLILEESVRPYVLLELAGLYLARPQAPVVYAGPGAGAGVDVFVADGLTLGARVLVDLLLTTDAAGALAVRVGLGGGLLVTTYF
jgi:outer membrane protein